MRLEYGALELVGFVTRNIAILQLVVQSHKGLGTSNSMSLDCPQCVDTSHNVEFLNKYVSQRIA